MTSTFRHEVTLAATVEHVVRILTDPAGHAARYEAAGATGAEVTSRIVDPAGAIRLVSRRAEGGSLPGPIARLVRGAAQLTQTENWAAPEPDGTRRATWTVITRGVPVDIGGTIAVRPSAAGAVLVETGTITARVPLLGALVERVASEQAATKLALEWRWLAEQVRLAGSVG